MLNAYIYEGLRTPFGRYAGSLAKVRPDDLMASAIRSVMAVTKFKAEQIEDIVLGCANQAGEDARCVARHAGLSADLPIEIPGTVLQRNCASGLGSIIYAAHSLTAGEGDVFLDAARPGNAHIVPAITALRARLLAEHCGHDEATVAAALTGGTGMAQLVDELPRRGKYLEPFVLRELGDTEKAIADTALFDAETPEEIFEPMARRRGLFRRGGLLRRPE